VCLMSKSGGIINAVESLGEEPGVRLVSHGGHILSPALAGEPLASPGSGGSFPVRPRARGAITFVNSLTKVLTGPIRACQFCCQCRG